MTSFSLAIAHLRYRIRHFLVLSVLGFITALIVVGTSTIYDSSVQAVGESIRTNLGDAAYALQTVNPTAIEALTASGQFSQVNDERGQVRKGELLAPGLIRATRTMVPLGSLETGRRASQPGEATVTRSLAFDLNAKIGDSITVQAANRPAHELTIVGLTVDTGDRDAAAVSLLDPDLVPTETVTWLSDTDPYSIAPLQPFLDARTATYQSVSSIVAQAELNPPQQIAPLDRVPVAAIALLLSLNLAVMGLLASSVKRDIDGLLAVGMSSHIAWRHVIRLAFAATMSGQVVGSGAAIGVIWLLRDRISSLVAQDWASVSLPVGNIVLLLSLTFVLSLFAARVTLALREGMAYLSRARFLSTAPRVQFVVLLLLAGISLTLIAYLQSVKTPPGRFAKMAPLGVSLVAVSIATLLIPIVALRTGQASRVVIKTLASGLGAVVAVAMLVAIYSGTYSALTYHNAEASDRLTEAPQPSGSYLIFRVPDSAAEALASIYRAEGGSQIQQFEIPDETSAQLRVTSVELLDCMAQAGTDNPDAVPPSCFPQLASSPINTVLLARPNEAHPEPLADRHLITNGEVALLLFKDSSGRVSSSSTVKVASSAILGGNMSGLVLPSSSPIVAEFGLRSSGTSLLALLDFGQLDRQQQARVRSSVARLAPAAETSDASGVSVYDAEKSAANAVALVGAFLVFAVVLIGGTTVALGHQQTRRVVVDSGASLRYRLELATRWAALPLVAFASCAVLTLTAASIASINVEGTYGAFWIAPSLAGSIASLMLIVVLMRVPDRSTE